MCRGVKLGPCIAEGCETPIRWGTTDGYIGRHRAGVQWIQIQGCNGAPARVEIPRGCWERIMRKPWVEGASTWISAAQSDEIKRDTHYRLIAARPVSAPLIPGGQRDNTE